VLVWDNLDHNYIKSASGPRSTQFKWNLRQRVELLALSVTQDSSTTLWCTIVRGEIMWGRAIILLGASQRRFMMTRNNCSCELGMSIRKAPTKAFILRCTLPILQGFKGSPRSRDRCLEALSETEDLEEAITWSKSGSVTGGQRSKTSVRRPCEVGSELVTRG
jgi:hypothetical protein